MEEKGLPSGREVANLAPTLKELSSPMYVYPVIFTGGS